MNLRHVEAFRAVMLAGSMTGAARDLNTSQPNVSRLIAQLETETGFRLFERTGARLLPTTEGNAFFQEVERAFVGLRGLAVAARRIRDLGTGRLRIAAVPSTGLTLIPEAIDRFRKRRPDVTVSLHMNNSSTVNQWAASQFCDLGVAVYIGDASACDVEPLSLEPAVCVLPATHRLAGQRRIRARDLEGESFISLCHGDGTRVQMDQAFDAAGVQRVLAIEAQYSAICCEMVRLGMGVTLAHPLVARDFLSDAIAVRAFTPELKFPTYLLFPPHQPRAQLTTEFVTVLRELLDERMAEVPAFIRPARARR